MEKVVTINLNGNSYQLDETAFEALRAYLASADAALKDNPDKAEILADIEQAIANKCAAFLGPGKSVISEPDMAHALREMGPVEDEPAPAADAKHEDATSAEPASEKRARRLYRLPDGAMIAGVASGLAAYFKIDPALIRLLFIVAAIVTHGLAVIAYIVLMFVIPSPHTPEEWAAAHNAPFNAQDVIERAKREYEDFARNGGFSGFRGPRSARRAWRRAERQTRRAARQAERAMRRARYWGAPPYPPPPFGAPPYTPPAFGGAPYAPPVGPIGIAVRAFAGLFALVFGLIGAALTIAFLVVLFSLITTGAVLGWTPPGGLPLWAVLVIVIVAFAAIGGPISSFRRAASGAMRGGGYYGGAGAFDSVVWLGLLILGGWLSYLYIPAAHLWLDQLWIATRAIGADLSHTLDLSPGAPH
jgi:phage shock protein PspC (stress-responsive transcriptional regulator)